MKRFLLFALTSGVTIAVVAWSAAAVLGPRIGESGVRAIVMSAGIAFSVQCLTFGVAMAIMPASMMLGWGAGILIRLFTLAMHGFAGVRLLGLDAAPALVSLAVFFFLTTLIEPFFLIRRDPTKPQAPSAT